MEEASQTAFEIYLDTSYDMGFMAYDDVGPSHTFAHGDTYRSPSTSSTTSPLPTTRTSPLLTTRTTPVDVYGRDKMRFMPTPGAVPPEFVNTKYPTIQGKKCARLGDTIVASVKEAHPNGKVKKGKVVFGVVVRATMQHGRCDGSEVKFDDNVVVLVDKQG
ncbi:uncharacterized protein LOC115961369 [Quercus lobata]|nr:uncharacterized protein LOC115961369 [Quercus lobata]